jgi:outer membrane protein OmpA-like peptidoglycan-associated protein
MFSAASSSPFSKLEMKLRTMPKRWLAIAGIGITVASVAAGIGVSRQTQSSINSPTPMALTPTPSAPSTAQSTFALTPSTDMAVGSPKIQTGSAEQSTAPTAPLALKMEMKLLSLEFGKGSTELTAATKVELDAKVAEYKAAHKVHVRGFSGNMNIAYSVRKGLAFERALRVKNYLVEQGVEAKTIRLFYQSQDHLGQPRAEVTWYMSDADAEKDVHIKR